MSSGTVGEGHASNRGKSVIGLSTREVPAPSENGNNILLNSDILLESDGKIRMQYVVSDPEPNVGDGTRGTMDVYLTASDKRGGCGPRLS